MVAPAPQSRGLGRRLLKKVRASVAKAGGTRLYVETSSRSQYEPTRNFHLKHGFREQARLTGFYAPGDDKIIYCMTPL